MTLSSFCMHRHLSLRRVSKMLATLFWHVVLHKKLWKHVCLCWSWLWITRMTSSLSDSKLQYRLNSWNSSTLHVLSPRKSAGCNMAANVSPRHFTACIMLASFTCYEGKRPFSNVSKIFKQTEILNIFRQTLTTNIQKQNTLVDINKRGAIA